MVESIKNVASKWRKKYGMAMIMLFAGIGLAYTAEWSAGEFTLFCGTLLGIFGSADLIDKEKFKQIAPKVAE